MISPEAEIIARIRREIPGAEWAMAVDHRGAWARVGAAEARSPISCADALQRALEKARPAGEALRASPETPDHG